LSLLGNALDAAGASAEAVHVLRQAQQRYPDDGEINFQLAWALDHRPGPPTDQQAEEVVRFYTVARALRPRNVPFHQVLGSALCRRNQLDEAVAVFRRTVALSPDEVLHHYWLATAQLAAGDRGGYRRTCAAMLDRFGRTDRAVVAQRVAWTTVLTGESVADLDVPVRLAEEALRRDPAAGGYTVTLGATLYRAGRFDEAVQRLNEADAAARPTLTKQALYSPAYAWFFLAMSHYQLGQGECARAWLDKATEWAEREMQNKGMFWTRRCTLRLLRSEAQALVLGKKN
jgi:tetratricopeptide (TPR) repeat protein